MLDLFLIGFFAAVLLLGLKRPFFWVLLYIYVDSVAPQRMGWGPITGLPLSLIAFLAAFAGYIFFDRKEGSRFGFAGRRHCHRRRCDGAALQRAPFAQSHGVRTVVLARSE